MNRKFSLEIGFIPQILVYYHKCSFILADLVAFAAGCLCVLTWDSRGGVLWGGGFVSKSALDSWLHGYQSSSV